MEQPPRPVDLVAALDQPVAPLRVALVTTAFDPRIPVDPVCADAARDVASRLERAGHTVVELAPTEAMAEVMDIYPRTIIPAWLSATELAHPERLQPYLRRTIARGREIDAGTYVEQARRWKLLAREISRTFFADHDLVLTPTAATRVPRTGVVWAELREKAPSRECAVYEQTLAFTTVPSAVGSPALSVPTHVDADGLPVGVQLVASQFDEALLLRVGRFLERSYGWLDRVPAAA